MTAKESELEPIDPQSARELFLDHKELDCSEATIRNYRYRLKPFLKWCEENDIDNLNDISGRDLQTYRLWRRETGDLKPVTMRMQMASFRVFIKWAGDRGRSPESL
ncbi:site-specific integrase [Halorhabdus sp. CUG00001]|uniref:site-specific integrase n=1 Tax=Halorhabdus sp. CUG00001 TaxID=2600297 RepID=UPI001E5D4E66|nr:site-specific integrase [Halorhabdus sp. CUG00001]